MKPYLLDVNLLIALTWPSHVHHSVAQKWFAAKRRAGFRTCPLTQIGFVRITSNPRFTPDSVSPADALALLQRIVSLPEHKFWPDDIDLLSALAHLEPIVGHRQVTDAYLLGLARVRKGKLATLDRGILFLAEGRQHDIELLHDNVH